MHLVALDLLVGPIEAEAAALAADLGTALYDERLNLAAGFPALLLATPDGERAKSVRGRLEARGQDAFVCGTEALVASEDMISMRRFRLDDRGVEAEDRPGERLPFDAISVMARAVHHRHTESRTQVKEKSFSLGTALITGGLSMSQTVTRNVVTVRDDAEDVLYLFRHDGGTPWILRQSETLYQALGGAMTQSLRANFLATAALLRERAPAAAADDRLLAFRRIPERAERAGGQMPALALAHNRGTDVMAHLLAQSHH